MIVSRELIDDLNNGKTVVSDVGATIPGITTLEEKFQFLYEACRAAVKDDLNTAKVAVALKAAGLDADAQWLRRNLAQVIWVLVQEVSSQEALYTKVKDLVQDLSKAALVTKTELLEVGAVPFLVELGVIPFNKNSRENVIRADLFYRILKFNSLREENEGFSKMLVCLHGFGAAAAESTNNIPQIVLEIKSLIGYFHLDPNKVAALLLDIWQDQWENEAYLCLLPLFSIQAISASLAFTFISYQKDGEVPPDNLYRLVVQLLKVKAVKLEALWTHLYHEDAVMEKLQQDALKAAYNAFIARNALNRGEEAESRPGQDNLLNMTDQQVEALQASYKISAAVLNLDPRKLSTDALQPVWGLNQKLELLKIAFEVPICPPLLTFDTLVQTS